MKQIKKGIKTIAIVFLWVIIWQLAAYMINLDLLLPSPITTLKALITLFYDTKFYTSVAISLLRIATGYLLGVFCGISGAVLSHRFRFIRSFSTPVLRIISAVPVASFIILALVWFHSTTLPIFICFLMVLPMIWNVVLSGLDNIDVKYLELAKVYKLDSFKVLFKLKLRFILPTLISTSLTALGFAWKSGIAAEVICRPSHSLGNMLQEAKIYISTPEVFALTAVVAILSLLLELLIRRLLRRFTND